MVHAALAAQIGAFTAPMVEVDLSTHAPSSQSASQPASQFASQLASQTVPQPRRQL